MRSRVQCSGIGLDRLTARVMEQAQPSTKRSKRSGIGLDRLTARVMEQAQLSTKRSKRSGIGLDRLTARVNPTIHVPMHRFVYSRADLGAFPGTGSQACL